MGKGNRHMKQLKSEKAKVKLKAKKVKHLPKGLNVTDTTFKVKKIVIREQLKQHDETEILSKRKLNVKDLLTRFHHHNTSVRQEAVRELKEILSQYSPTILSSQFGSLLQGVSALSLDREKDIRRDSLKVLALILGPVSNEQLTPYCDVLISYLRCAMTHIDQRIKEDALLFLDVLVQNCSGVLARHSHKVLPNFLDMISRMHTEIKPGRQLTTTINSTNTSVTWRIKVLERLTSMFSSIVTFYKFQKSNSSNISSDVIYINDKTRYIPVYPKSNSQLCEIDFEQNNDSADHVLEKGLDAGELMKYVELLMPLVFDSWIEVCPTEKNSDHSELLISNEASELLKIVVDIIHLITECIDMLSPDCELNMKLWFKNNFFHLYMKNLFEKFPYSKPSPLVGRTKKRQGDFSITTLNNTCLGHNLVLCQIYVWFSSIHSDTHFPHKLNKKHCTSVLEYLNDKLVNWSNADNQMLPQLTMLLKTLFLRASKTWYQNNIKLSQVLRSVVGACSDSSKREMQLQLFSIVSDIMLDHTLNDLHREYAFKEFVSTLPNVLLKSRIHESTIQMINRIVLRYREWIQEQLVANHAAIIENAKKIEIIGSQDVKRSRLTICNLFYFMDTQIYY